MTFTHTDYDFENEFPKLVRDRIREIMESRGHAGEYSTATGAELLKLLLKKLIEEAKEAAKAENEEELNKELADVMEVFQAILAQTNTSLTQIERIQTEIRNKNGGFEKGLVLVKKG